MKTLYVSDLDGTLLGSDMSLSAFTVQTINRLIRQGMCFTYATARSVHSSAPLTATLDLRLPVITHNGGFLVDPLGGNQTLNGWFSEEERMLLYETSVRFESFPMLNAELDGRHRLSYLSTHMAPPMQEFIQNKVGERRLRETHTGQELFAGLVYYATFIGEEATIYALYQSLLARGCFELHYQKDIYSGHPWLEVMPKGISKASAILKLKASVGADRLVVFGDAVNDLDMFAVADEAYAMANAIEALKERATAVIASNDEDGVARWLKEHYK